MAIEPLWQLAHPPGVTPLWLKVAGVHAVVRWQASHDSVVGRWLDGLPAAVDPLWQLAHAPGVTPLWLNVAGVHAVVR